MTYDKHILQVLSEVGEQGISVQMLAKHVYNLSCTLFAVPDLAEVHRYVQQYLLKNSKSGLSLIERTGRRGYYRLNTVNNADARQLFLEFRHKPEETEPKDDKPQPDFSLSLFD